MSVEANKDILRQFGRLCERENMNSATVLLWFMDKAVSDDRLPLTAEDLNDWLVYREAKAEYDQNPVTFTHETVKKMLGLEQKNTCDDVEEEALFYSPKNIERLKRDAAALDAGEGVEHDIIEVDDDDYETDTKNIAERD